MPPLWDPALRTRMYYCDPYPNLNHQHVPYLAADTRYTFPDSSLACGPSLLRSAAHPESLLLESP